jgi:hypothetical protein
VTNDLRLVVHPKPEVVRSEGKARLQCVGARNRSTDEEHRSRAAGAFIVFLKRRRLAGDQATV